MRESGVPMTPGEVAAAVNEQFGTSTTRGSVNGELYRGFRQGVFTRPTAGHYGLAGLQAEPSLLDQSNGSTHGSV